MKLLKQPRIRAPELTPEGWAAGEPHLLGALRGRVVLLDFFSFGDPAGMRALAHLRMLGEHYREAGLVVIGVHVPAYDFERPLEEARQEIWRIGIPYAVALDQRLEVFRAYEARDLPSRYVIDAAGFVRAWHHGPGGLAEAERAVRALLREAHPGRELPHVVELPTGMLRPGDLHWLSSPEVRFGTRGAGFGLPDPSGPPAADGDTREFGELPELRAQGHAYLEGRWRIRRDRVVTTDSESAVAVVFEGASVAAVLSPEPGHEREEKRLEVTLDGEPPAPPAAGVDLETVGGRALLPLKRGRLYELISRAEFGLHNLDVRVHGRGVAFHLLHFGSSEVPEEA